MEVTKEQFKAYVTIQTSGAYNMFDPRARAATGLDKGTYLTIMKDYNELEDKYANNNE